MHRSLMWPLERAAAVRGSHLATVCGDRRRTWSEVKARVLGLIGGLRELGLAPGDRVSVLMLNSDRHLESWFAIPGGGFVMADLNFRPALEELRFTVQDSGARALIVDDAHVAVGQHLRALVPCLEFLIYAGDGEAPNGTISYEALTATEPGAASSVNDDDLAAIFYTGGTTGISKGALLTHDNLLHNAMHTIGLMQLTAEDVYLHAAPQFHLADGSATYAITWQGARHVFIPSFEPVATILGGWCRTVRGGDLVGGRVG